MKNEVIEVEIINWKKYNPKEVFKTPRWFKINIDIVSSSSLFGLSTDTKWVWICLLSEAMRKKCEIFTLNIAWTSHYWNLKPAVILKAIELLEKNNMIRVNSESTRSQLGVCSETEGEEKEKENRRRGDICNIFDFEEIYKLYPKRPNQNKERGFSILEKTVKTSTDFALCVKSVGNYEKYVSSQKIESRFIKQFSTWTNQWKEWIEEPVLEKSGAQLWGEEMEKKEREELEKKGVGHEIQ